MVPFLIVLVLGEHSDWVLRGITRHGISNLG